MHANQLQTNPFVGAYDTRRLLGEDIPVNTQPFAAFTTKVAPWLHTHTMLAK